MPACTAVRHRQGDLALDTEVRGCSAIGRRQDDLRQEPFPECEARAGPTVWRRNSVPARKVAPLVRSASPPRQDFARQLVSIAPAKAQRAMLLPDCALPEPWAVAHS